MSFKKFCNTLGEIRPQAVILGEASVDRYYIICTNSGTWTNWLHHIVFCHRHLWHSSTSVTIVWPSHVVLLEQATIGQSNNPVWMEQRKGRCTASYFKDICTFRDQSRTDAQHLIAKIMQTQSAVPSDVPALKYDRRMEDVDQHIVQGSVVGPASCRYSFGSASSIIT